MPMQKITFTNGIRIFTNSNPPLPTLSLGDINNDGTIDILDASDANSMGLEDFNNDGVIDILDVSEFNARGPGGIIVSGPNGNPGKSPFEVCPEGGTAHTPINGMIITTGCTSIPDPPPLPPGIGEEPWGCPAPKVLGFGINYETGNIKYEGCVCAESSVNLADIAILVGTGLYGAVRKNLINSIKESIARLKQDLLALKNYLFQANKINDFFTGDIHYIQQLIDMLRENIRNGEFGPPDGGFIDPVTGIFVPVDDYETQIRHLLECIDEAITGSGGAGGNLPPNYMNKNYWVVQIERATAKKGLIEQEIANLEKELQDILNVLDPTALFTAFVASYIPISFVVPKECGYPFVLNAACECVADEGGSGSGE